MNTDKLKRRLVELKERRDTFKYEHHGKEISFTSWGGWSLGFIEGRISEIEEILLELEESDVNDVIEKPLSKNSNLNEIALEDKKENDKALYIFNNSVIPFNKGIFIAKKNHIKILLENKLEVYFGDVLGEHSCCFGSLDDSDFIFVSDDIEVIKTIEDNNLEKGHNPFNYIGQNHGREDFEYLNILQIVEILEKEKELEYKRFKVCLSKD